MRVEQITVLYNFKQQLFKSEVLLLHGISKCEGVEHIKQLISFIPPPQVLKGAAGCVMPFSRGYWAQNIDHLHCAQSLNVSHVAHQRSYWQTA